MVDLVKHKEQFLQAKTALLTVSSILGAFVVIAGAYTLYQNTVYKPKKDLKVLEVDYEKGVAKVRFKDETITLIGDTTWALKGNWGIKFGSANGKYENITIVQSGMNYDYLDVKKA